MKARVLVQSSPQNPNSYSVELSSCVMTDICLFIYIIHNNFFFKLWSGVNNVNENNLIICNEYLNNVTIYRYVFTLTQSENQLQNFYILRLFRLLINQKLYVGENKKIRKENNTILNCRSTACKSDFVFFCIF